MKSKDELKPLDKGKCVFDTPEGCKALACYSSTKKCNSKDEDGNPQCRVRDYCRGEKAMKIPYRDIFHGIVYIIVLTLSTSISYSLWVTGGQSNACEILLLLVGVAMFFGWFDTID